MFKYLSLTLLISQAFLNASKELVVDDAGKLVSQAKNEKPKAKSLEQAIWQEFDKIEAEMAASMKALKEEFKKEEPFEVKQSIGLDIQEDADNVIIKITAPELDGSIDVHASKNNLDGSFTTKSEGSINFKITDGKFIQLSQKLEEKKSEDKDGAKFKSMMASSSSQLETLPAEVGNLEQAKVDMAGNVIKIVLPKLESKSNWKSIKVNKN